MWLEAGYQPTTQIRTAWASVEDLVARIVQVLWVEHVDSCLREMSAAILTVFVDVPIGAVWIGGPIGCWYGKGPMCIRPVDCEKRLAIGSMKVSGCRRV